MSGGEKQRLSIARALLRRPHLLVFDEATSSLDSLTEEEIGQTIRDVGTSQDVMTILIAHRLSTIMHADRIYVLERGSITESGTHAQLLEEKGLYYAMWRQQIGEKSGRRRSQCPRGRSRSPDQRGAPNVVVRVHAVAAVVGELGHAAQPKAPQEQDARAGRPRDLCRKPRLAVDLATLVGRHRPLVHARQQAETERQVVDGLDLHPHQLVVRLADPGARLEMPHHLSVVGLRSGAGLRRQRGEDRVDAVDRFTPQHLDVVDAEDVFDRGGVFLAGLVLLSRVLLTL